MTRYRRRLSSTNAREMFVRSVQAGWIAAERLSVAARPVRWSRNQLLSILAEGPQDLSQLRVAMKRADWSAAGEALQTHFLNRERRFVIHPADRAKLAREAEALFPEGREHAIRRAAPVLNGRYSLLGYDALSFAALDGDIDWHLDPVHKRRAPVSFWAGVPYLDPRIGDHKIIWELNRHQHWLALGRAAWLSGDDRYSRRFTFELASWLKANPPLMGINWASPLEIAFRSISWLWSLHLFAAFDDEVDPVWLVDLLVGLQLQLDHLARHRSDYFSPNTHLLGEGLALYVAGRVLPELKSSSKWESIGRRILMQESVAQINPDGGHAELSSHYHRYTLDFYMLALAVARASEDPDADFFARVTEALATYCRVLAGDDGWLPGIGDDDGGVLFPICGRSPADASDSLALAASLLRRSELAVGNPPEEVLWMLGGDSSALTRPEPVSVLAPRSVLYPATGYAILGSRSVQGILDGGRFGFLNGGHAHSDALSLVLKVHGRPLLIDPGTATYTMDPRVRDRFRSTPMHNTVSIDGRSQSEPDGPFHWKARADARFTVWRPHAHGDYAEAEHDGYRPLVHRRGVLRLRDGLWIVVDHVLGTGAHRADAFWHFDPAWRLIGASTHSAQVSHPEAGTAFLACTCPLSKEYRGDADGLGWCSPVYGRVAPSLTLQFSAEGSLPLTLITAIIPAARRGISVEKTLVRAGRNDGWHRAAAVVTSDEERALVIAATQPAGSSGDDAGVGKRVVQTVETAGGTFETDALAAVLRVSAAGRPCSLDLIDAREARWTGMGPFELSGLDAAQDLHWDHTALQQLIRGSERRAL